MKGDKFYGTGGSTRARRRSPTIRSQAPFRVREDQSYFSRATGEFITRADPRLESAGHFIPQGLKRPTTKNGSPVTRPRSAAISRSTSIYQYKTLHDPFEDMPRGANLYDANVYFGSFQAQQLHQRQARLQRRHARHHEAVFARLVPDANYTYSHLYGNFDDDFCTSQYNNSSALQDEPGPLSNDPASIRNGDPPAGPAAHLQAPGELRPSLGFIVGGFLRCQSGTPLAGSGCTRRASTLRAATSSRPAPAASRPGPTSTSSAPTRSTSAAKCRRPPRRTRPEPLQHADRLDVNRLQYTDPYVDGTPASTAIGPQGTSQPNPLFGTPTSWAAPRRFVLTAYFNS